MKEAGSTSWDTVSVSHMTSFSSHQVFSRQQAQKLALPFVSCTDGLVGEWAQRQQHQAGLLIWMMDSTFGKVPMGYLPQNMGKDQ